MSVVDRAFEIAGDTFPRAPRDRLAHPFGFDEHDRYRWRVSRDVYDALRAHVGLGKGDPEPGDRLLGELIDVDPELPPKSMLLELRLSGPEPSEMDVFDFRPNGPTPLLVGRAGARGGDGMSEVIPDIEPIRVRLQAAAPHGWYISPTTIERSFEPRQGHPSILYEVEALTKRPVGKRGAYVAMRSVEVTIRAATVEALEAAVRALPSLDPFLALPLDTEVRMSGWDD